MLVTPNLFSLDCAFTLLSGIKNLKNCLSALPKLRITNCLGSPVCLTPNYRSILKQHFSQLRSLDGLPAFSEAEEVAKKKKCKRFDAYGNEIRDDSHLLPIEQAVTFELNFGLVSNL